MRILILPASYLPIMGGMQTTAHSLARQFQIQGHTVLVVTQRHPRSLQAYENIDGIMVQRLFFLRPEPVYIRTGRPDLFLAGAVYARITKRKFQHALQNFKPDVLNVHFPDQQIPFVLSTHQQSPCRLVISLHGNEILRWLQQPKPAAATPGRLEYLRSVLLKADAITACSQYLLEKAIAIEPAIMNKAVVIHNGIDLARFQDRTKYPHPRPYIFAFGRMTPAKGFDLLLDAFNQVSAKFPEVDLILAGDGEQYQKLSETAQREGLEKRVFFYGRASPAEIVQLLNGCLFAVSPSRQETFGISALETLAAGKPLLATRVGGIPEFVPKKGNCLVELEVGSLSAGIQKLMVTYQDHFLAETGVLAQNKKIASQMDWSSVAKKYLDIFFHDRIE